MQDRERATCTQQILWVIMSKAYMDQHTSVITYKYQCSKYAEFQKGTFKIALTVEQCKNASTNVGRGTSDIGLSSIHALAKSTMCL